MAKPFDYGKMEMYLRVAYLLNSEAARSVNFQLDQVVITGVAAYQVVRAYLYFEQFDITDGIKIRFGHVPLGAAASYDDASNTLDFPDPFYGLDAFQRQTIIHECTHAYLDARVPTPRAVKGVNGPLIATNFRPHPYQMTTDLTDEAVAFVAGHLFHLHEKTLDGTPPTAPSWATPPCLPVFATAFNIALKIMNQPGAIVPAGDVKQLQDDILATPGTVYSDLKANPNKISVNGI
jgi:hypothetical protein